MQAAINIQQPSQKSVLGASPTGKPSKKGRPVRRVFMDIFKFKENNFDVRKYAPLSIEEALEKYDSFIRKIAWKYLPYISSGLDFDDLVSAGKFGVFMAVRKYDPLKVRYKTKDGRNISTFSTYVKNSICWYIKTEIKPFVEPECIALDAPMGEDGSALHELIADQNADSLFQSVATATDCDKMWRFVEKLSPSQQTVIKLRYKEGKTLEQVGRALGITRERVRQIEKTAIGKLKKMIVL